MKNSWRSIRFGGMAEMVDPVPEVPAQVADELDQRLTWRSASIPPAPARLRQGAYPRRTAGRLAADAAAGRRDLGAPTRANLCWNLDCDVGSWPANSAIRSPGVQAELLGRGGEKRAARGRVGLFNGTGWEGVGASMRRRATVRSGRAPSGGRVRGAGRTRMSAVRRAHRRPSGR